MTHRGWGMGADSIAGEPSENGAYVPNRDAEAALISSCNYDLPNSASALRVARVTAACEEVVAPLPASLTRDEIRPAPQRACALGRPSSLDAGSGTGARRPNS